MGSFNLRTKTIILPEEINLGSNKIHVFPTIMNDHFGVIQHHLGIHSIGNNAYKAKKQGEIKHIPCKEADLEFAFYFKNIPIIKLTNKTI
jgi:hypothetical protein